MSTDFSAGSDAAKERGLRLAEARRQRKIAATLEDCKEPVTLPAPPLPKLTGPARGVALRVRRA